MRIEGVVGSGGGGGGSGTVTSVSVVTANGVSGSVANPTTTPAITLTLGAIAPTSVNGLTISTSTGTLTLTNGKTFSVTNTLTLSGTDDSTLNIGAGGTLGSNAFSNTSFVPTTTTVNGKALSANITLSLASSDFANQGTTTTVLHGNAAGNPSFGQVVNSDIANSTIDLTTKVTGALSVPNGGTGLASGTSGGIPYFSGSTTIASSAALGANLPVVGGGAGVAPSTLANPGANTLLAFDNTDGSTQFITIGSGLTYTHSTHTLSASAGGANPAGSGSEIQARSNSTTFAAVTNSTTTGGRISLLPSDTGTSNVVNALSLTHNSSGAITTNFGVGLRLGLQDDTLADQDAGLMYAAWSTATHASRSSFVGIQAVNSAAALADVVKFSFTAGGVSQVIAQGAGAAGVPQFTNSIDPQTGFGVTTSNFWIRISGNDKAQFTGGGLFIDSIKFDFNSGDCGLSRDAAGIVQVNSGAAGTLRDIKARNYLCGNAGAPTANDTAVAAFADNTSKPTLAANTTAFYQKAGEMFVQDAAGNETLLSPHDDAGRWVFDSNDGKRGLRIDVERLLRFLNGFFGMDFIHEYEVAI